MPSRSVAATPACQSAWRRSNPKHSSAPAVASASSAMDNAAADARQGAAELKADTQVAMNDARDASANAANDASAKANELGVKVLDEDGLLKLFDEHGVAR